MHAQEPAHALRQTGRKTLMIVETASGSPQ